ncbi:unnamed protein product [Didymodactylos carnosus]|uniref:Uncharacterized protein n=1 Tax=Didymodactylos carnosus TaxID=1234261 RepID=A0A814ZJG9_9BILA|nr:unnamed protein product [Didymodactylos carnosus]CAF1411977.1 unnamed protein product [Didymodactylos carnosus]CAF4012284.1 unnamed protein product [Didymodactylos carnosus]CAF4215713.1 unnamed protein product [Didymodactylos carnosus]
MNPANIVQCISQLISVSLDVNKTVLSPEERELAKHLTQTIISLDNCKCFDYEEETTLDIRSDFDDRSDANDDTEDDKCQYTEGGEHDQRERDEEEHHKLKNYSTYFMAHVVEFVDEKTENGKTRRSWKTVHHRFRSILD